MHEKSEEDESKVELEDINYNLKKFKSYIKYIYSM